MAIYFFSDAHLGEADKDKEKIKLEKLSAFFEMVNNDGEKLFILGDLFDFWFEYKHAIPKEHLKTIFRLAQMVESGMEVGEAMEKLSGIKEIKRGMGAIGFLTKGLLDRVEFNSQAVMMAMVPRISGELY